MSPLSWPYWVDRWSVVSRVISVYNLTQKSCLIIFQMRKCRTIWHKPSFSPQVWALHPLYIPAVQIVSTQPRLQTSRSWDCTFPIVPSLELSEWHGLFYSRHTCELQNRPLYRCSLASSSESYEMCRNMSKIDETHDTVLSTVCWAMRNCEAFSTCALGGPATPASQTARNALSLECQATI